MYPGVFGSPGDARTGTSPIVRGVTSYGGVYAMRIEQVLAGGTPFQLVQNTGYPGSVQQLAGPTRWPGPVNQLGRQFRPGIGANAGLRSQGDRQDNFNLKLSPPNIPWARQLARSLRSVTQNYNQTAINVAIPSVFVPTSASNFYGQLGSA